MAKIRVELQMGKYPSHSDRVIELPLSENLLYEALEPLDLPDQKAPAFAQMMCSSTLKIQTVMVERERMAKILSEALTRALLDAMKHDDTLMGGLGKGREPTTDVVWSDFRELCGKENSEGKFCCPECGRWLKLTSFGAGNGPLAFPPHLKPSNV